MSWWSKKKSDSCSDTYVNAKEDPNLTRFYNRSCNKCGKRSQHELARFAKGSPKAYLTCGSCGHWVETKW
jgi:transcription elongation factor Elf1